MDLTNLFEEAPAFALCLVAGLVVVSHMWNAARILDRRRAHRLNRARAARSSAKAAAFLATYADATPVDAGPTRGRFLVHTPPLHLTRREI